jgi:hypothetical protein
MLMARTAAPERSTLFLTRCNLQPSTPLHEVADPAVSRPELAFKIAIDEGLYLIEQAVARIKQGAGAEAALRELWAALLEVKAKVARDPGIRMAADDLYTAAAALVAATSAGSDEVSARHERLLKEADARLRDRLATARPSEKPKLFGLN